MTFCKKPPLTNEQRRMAEKHHPLVLWYVRRLTLPMRIKRELIGELSLVLCRLVRAYDPERGVKFSHYAIRSFRRMTGLFLGQMWEQLPCDRSIPFDLHEPDDNIPESAVYLLDNCENIVGERAMRILQLRLVDGWTYRRIGELLGIHQGTVSQIVATSLGKLRRSSLAG